MDSRAQYWLFQDHILRDTEIYGTYFNLNRALDGPRAVILDFDLSNFTSKDIVPPKQTCLVTSLFSECLEHGRKVRYYHKIKKLVVCKQHMLMIFSFPY